MSPKAVLGPGAQVHKSSPGGLPALPPSGVPGAGSRPEKPASILAPGEGDAEVTSREVSLPQP